MKFYADNYGINTAMNVRTREEYDDFTQHLEELGMTWRGHRRYQDYFVFDDYCEDTCIFFNDGSFSNIKLALELGAEILLYSDFDWSNDDSNADDDFSDIEKLF